MTDRPRPARLFASLITLMLLGAGATATQAQSLRCNDAGVREGDSKVWLMRACGQPTFADHYCARVPQPVVAVPQGGVVVLGAPVCMPTDEWLYERGPGNLPAVVRMREGRILSIRFGEQGRSEPR